MVRASLTLLLLLISTQACSTTSNETSDPNDGLMVRRADAGNSWPLTVESGSLSCVKVKGSPLGGIVFSTEDGTKYGINGTAASTGDYADVRLIWQKSRYSGYKNMTWLLGKGETLCKKAN